LPHTFTLFIALHSNILCIILQILRYYIAFLYIVTSPHFILHFLTSTFTVACCHSFLMAWWSILHFCLCMSHCSLLFVIGKLHVMWLKTMPWASQLGMGGQNVSL